MLSNIFISRRTILAMTCTRCGNELSEYTAICPICGTASSKVNASSGPSTVYGQFPERSFGEQPPYQQGYVPPVEAFPPPQANAIPPQQAAGYGPSYQGTPLYAAGSFNMSTASSLSFSSKNDGALPAEIIFSLFGIFDVGWFMSGPTPTPLPSPTFTLLISFPLFLPCPIFP